MTRRGATTSVGVSFINEFTDYRVSHEALADPVAAQRPDQPRPRSRDRRRHRHAGVAAAAGGSRHHLEPPRPAARLRAVAAPSSRPASSCPAPSPTPSSAARRAPTSRRGDRPRRSARPPRHRLRRPAARLDHRRAAADRCRGAVLQALLPRRLDQPPRLGPLRGQPADRVGPADRRPDACVETSARGAGAVRHQVERRRLRRRRQRRPQPVAASIPAASASAVGPGLRYDTPIGPVRFDVGYQLNPIAGLLVKGEPEAAAAGARTSASARRSDDGDPTSVAGSASARFVAGPLRRPAGRRHRVDADGVVQGLAAPLRDARGRRLPERHAGHPAASTATCSPGSRSRASR